MSWDDLEVSNEQAEKTQEAKKQEIRDLCQLCNRVFTTSDGQQFLAHLSQRFIFDNDTDLTHPNYQAASAYHNGERGVVKYIHHLMLRSQQL